MNYYVVVYNRLRGERLHTEEFEAARLGEAAQQRFKCELKYREDPNIEVVLLGAPSLDVLKRTHGRYFKTPAALGDELTALLG